MDTRKGKFAPTYIDWVDKTDEEQAIEILGLAKVYHAEGYKKIGITYSANHEQSMAINKCYQQNKWQTNIRGRNQAAVIAEVERLLLTDKYQHLQNVFQILPISTCARPGGIGAVEMQWLQEELNALDTFITDKNFILGWQDSTSIIRKDSPYAVGGGLSKQLTAEQNKLIQDTLINIEKKYSIAKDFDIESEKRGSTFINAGLANKGTPADNSTHTTNSIAPRKK